MARVFAAKPTPTPFIALIVSLRFACYLGYLKIRSAATPIMPPKKQGKYRFTDFEIDLAHRTLLRAGHPITLDPRTFNLLAVLILNAQRVVPNEELMRVLGPDSTGEESNLNQHIFLLQKALSGFDPGEKLILRIPGLGYKFTAQVTELPPDPDPEPVVIFEPTLEAPADPEGDQGPQLFPRFTYEPEELPKPPRTAPAPEPDAETEPEAKPSLWSKLTQPLPIAGILAVLLILAAGSWFAWHRLQQPKLEAKANLRLILTSFENTTSEQTFDQSLQTALTLDLQQSPYLSVPPQSLVKQSLADLKISQPISASASHQLCQQLAANAYLTANLRRLSHNYLVTVQAFDCATEKSLAQTRGIADNPDAVVAVLDKVTADLRKQLGESAKSVASFSKPLFSDRPSSLAALKAYADATHIEQQGKSDNSDEAIQLLQRAIFLDPKFALAYAALANQQAALAHTEEANAAQAKAYLLRDTVDDQHRFILIAAFNDRVTGDLQASLRNDKQWATLYPTNPIPLTHQADLEIQLGAPVLALDPARRALTLNPNNPAAYIILARAQMHLGQFEEATATCQQALQRHIDSAELHQFLLQIAFLRLDQPAIDEQLAWAKGKPAEPEMQLQQAQIAFAEGRAKTALGIYQAVAETYRKQNQPNRATEILAQLPRIQAELGQTEAARNQLTRLAETADSPEIPITWAYLGETTRAESILKRQLAAHPASTLWQQSWAPQIRASIALNQHQPQAAIDALNPTTPTHHINFDLSSFAIPAMRGKAYLASKQPTMAEGEFHKILDHPGLEPLSHNYPLAQLGLARALAAQGKNTESSFAYKIVLQIWKEADPDLPRFKEAKAEYAHIGSQPSKSTPKPKPHKK